MKLELAVLLLISRMAKVVWCNLQPLTLNFTVELSDKMLYLENPQDKTVVSCNISGDMECVYNGDSKNYGPIYDQNASRGNKVEFYFPMVQAERGKWTLKSGTRVIGASILTGNPSSASSSTSIPVTTCVTDPENNEVFAEKDRPVRFFCPILGSVSVEGPGNLNTVAHCNKQQICEINGPDILKDPYCSNSTGICFIIKRFDEKRHEGKWIIRNGIKVHYIIIKETSGGPSQGSVHVAGAESSRLTTWLIIMAVFIVKNLVEVT